MLSWHSIVSFRVTYSCSVRRGGKEITGTAAVTCKFLSTNCCSWSSVLHTVFPYTGDDCKESPSVSAAPRDCQLHQNRLVPPLCGLHPVLAQAGQWFCTVWMTSTGPNKVMPWGSPRKKALCCVVRVACSLLSRSLHSTEMQLLAVHSPRPWELLHSAASWWAPRRWDQRCSLLGLARVCFIQQAGFHPSHSHF